MIFLNVHLEQLLIDDFQISDIIARLFGSIPITSHQIVSRTHYFNTKFKNVQTVLLLIHNILSSLRIY